MSSLRRLSPGNFSNSKAVVVVGEPEAGRAEFGAERVEPAGALEPGFQVGFAVAHHAAGGQVLVADGLPELHVGVEVLLERFDRHVGGDGLEPGGVQLRADLLGRQVGHAAPLHIFPAHLADLLQRVGQVLLGGIAQGVELQRHGALFRRGGRGEQGMTSKRKEANRPQGFPAGV